MSRFPDFLIIGGMKCGSTTLYHDLLTNPRIFMPIDKEPNDLSFEKVLSPEGRASYARHFQSARADQLCGEASTGYTKRPDFQGAPERALEICGPRLRVIYIVRDPIKRIISHHHHGYSRGLMPLSIDEAVRQFPRLINYSRYAMQAEPWLHAFGQDHFRLVWFEDYVADRRGESSKLCEYLGVEPKPELIEEEKVYNASEGKPISQGTWRKISRHPFYRRFIRPFMSRKLKDRIREAVFPKAPPRPPAPSDETVAWIREQLAEDQARFEELFAARGQTSSA